VKSSSRDAIRSLLQVFLLGGMLLIVGCTTTEPTPLATDNPYLNGDFPWQSGKPLVKSNLKRGDNPLSDLTIVLAKNGWGPLERDRSNGSESDGDGSPITLNGKTYSKGLGVHAPSELQFDLNGNCFAFSSDVGLDDEINTQQTYGAVTFKVLVDGVEKYNSDVMRKKQVKSVQLDLTGAKKLVLKVEPDGDNHWFDHANWANPTIACMVESTGSSPGFTVGPDPANKGTFGPVTTWPVIPVHAAVLPTGKLLTWFTQDIDGGSRDDTSVPHDKTLATLWDPVSNTQTFANNNTTELFCAGAATNFDGQLIVAGGNLGGRRGSKNVSKFDANSSQWLQLSAMSSGRWYPTVKALPNREMLVIGGNNELVPEVQAPGTDATVNVVPDVIKTDNSIRRLTNATTTASPAEWSTTNEAEHYYPWMHVAPNGKVFYAGPRNLMSWLDTSNAGSWGSSVERGDGEFRKYGTSAMYDIGKVLVVGGGYNDCQVALCGLKSAYVIDINESNKAKPRAVASMKNPRVHANATILPDGQVAMIGGNQNGNYKGDNFIEDNSMFEAELWNPATETFKPAATMKTPRNYHSTAVLLPDGRVFSGGGGGCGGGCASNRQNVEIFYPPYLFKKDGSGQLIERPVITQAPATAAYGTVFEISSPDATITKSAVLMRLGSATHAFDQGQARVPISLERRSVGVLRLMAPANVNIAPPGVYMLFIIDSAGVPSKAQMIKLQ
jgi:hypothetical protein